MPPTDPEDAPRRVTDDYARYAGLGIQFAATMGVLGALGYWADTRLGTGPWLLVVGIFLGAVGGFVSLVKQVPAPRSRSSSSDPSDPPDAR